MRRGTSHGRSYNRQATVLQPASALATTGEDICYNHSWQSRDAMALTTVCCNHRRILLRTATTIATTFMENDATRDGGDDVFAATVAGTCYYGQRQLLQPFMGMTFRRHSRKSRNVVAGVRGKLRPVAEKASTSSEKSFNRRYRKLQPGHHATEKRCYH